jgi:hypothetical protein
MLDWLGNNTEPHDGITHASLHTNAGSPGDTGANEVTGGTYVRVAITFGTANAAQMNSDGTDPEFNVPAGTTVAYVGFCYSLSTADTCLAWDDVTQETFGSAGTYTLTDAQFNLS